MSEAEKVAELTEAATRKPHTVTIGHAGGQVVDVLLVPNDNGGYHQHCVKELLKPYLTAPERRQGTALLTDLESFIAHTKRFKDDDSAVFVDRTNANAPKLVSVLDYHRAGSDGKPRFGQHRGNYAFPMSDEWTTWTSQNGRYMGQDEFARFIEDHLADVADPAVAGDTAKAFVALLSCGFVGASKLLEVSRGLELHVGQRVKQHVKLATGETTMGFEESHTDAIGAPLKIPGAFLLGIPVFRNGERYQLPTRLRYRVAGGQVTWGYEIHRVADIRDHAIREACQDVAEETGLPVYEGTPE